MTGSLSSAGYGPAGADESARASRTHWDGASHSYLEEHGATLGTDDLVWGPEGLTEDEAHLLGAPADLVGQIVVEVGCGAAQGARWAAARGALAVGVDLSAGMLARSRALDAASGSAVPVLQADAGALPLADGCAAVAFSAYGALPFTADAGGVLTEVHRVLRPGGRWTFSVSHPVRWAFPDDPGPQGLVAERSYFDRAPYVERDERGALLYAEHHRTLGDWVRLLRSAGFRLLDLVEPEWEKPDQPTWGGWSALRGAHLPGTAIFVCERSR
ncbi:Methyltransferase domain-containing protein [Quadrisphaera granulorum]|uniref:Methyltransferase family protein n=1 Tax=Quadrisphaera granulorum TaxID=317664 RepID=A0A315ZY87_9ACTN|nr:class I SAM-dependent methyltransferase [Quadrisphaera granulorum]PWJ50631.1 methyltransferase family protein [Quadrisphaera granulorum]SZE97879.1 Methyltransferase domain-containing protein [Quadrisphaera granulorum]